jgi:voltage-gated potassium channel
MAPLIPPAETPFDPQEPGLDPRKERLWRIIFLSDTPAGRAFDVVLLIVIALSVFIVIIESVPSVHEAFPGPLRVIEWLFTLIFTAELAVRLWVVRNRRKYLFSFFGVVDVLSILPSYLELFFAGTHYLMTVRVLRLLRVFRVLKMAHHIDEVGTLLAALRASRRKIFVFMFSVLTILCVEGTLAYLVEHPHNPKFASIPHAMYWAVVTLTTVGYGDVVPVTPLGQVMATIVMLTGFAILAVPTGIVTAEIGRSMGRDQRTCAECGLHGHDARALFCHHCGTRL